MTTGAEHQSSSISELALQRPPAQNRLIQLPESWAPYKTTICSYAAALAGTTAGFPLDSMKTRLQTHKFRSTWQCFLDTKRNEGLSGFFRGMSAPLISSSVVRSVSVTIYQAAIPYTASFWYSLYKEPDNTTSNFQRMLRISPVTFSAGNLAGSVCSVISCPFEFTKLASQIELLVQRRKLEQTSAALASSQAAKSTALSTNKTVEFQPKGTGQIARELYSRGGILALFGGYRYHLARDFIGSAVYFTVYENFKLGISSMLKSNDSPHPLSIAIAGAMAGTVCWLIVYPIDTYKSIVQRDLYASMLSPADSQTAGMKKPREVTFRSMFRLKMYRGLGLSIVRTSLIGMTFFSVYEQLIKRI